MLQRPTKADMVRRAIVRMLARDVPLTDYVTISVTRILIEEGFFEEIESLWDGLAAEHEQWFIQKARAERLERRLADFGLTRPPAQSATGEVTFTADSAGATIPSGAIVKTKQTDPTFPVKRYRVAPNPLVVDGSWSVAADSSTTVRIVAQEPGEVGNTAANTIILMENQIAGILAEDGVSNAVAIINGKNAAGDDEFREYFRAWLLSLAGSTRGAILFGVLGYVDPDTGARPIHSVALEEWDGVDLLQSYALKVWIDDGSGAAPASLVEAIQALIDGSDTEPLPGLRPAGVRTLVVPATAINVPVTVSIDIERSVGAKETQDAVLLAIERFLTRVPVSGTTLTGEVQGQLVFAQLFKAAMNVPGVLRASFLTPQNNLTLAHGQKVVPGKINVSVASVT